MKIKGRKNRWAATVISMYNYSLYSAILGLSSKWHISHITEDKPSGLVELHIRSIPEGTFSCSACGEENIPAGMHNKRWFYNNRLNISFYISLYSPLILCKKCGCIRTIEPWKQSESIQPDLSA